MVLTLLKAKLHRIRVTEADLNYEGSLTLDPDDMEAVGIVPYEKILCADVENGNRFETYAIAGQRAASGRPLAKATAFPAAPSPRIRRTQQYGASPRD